MSVSSSVIKSFSFLSVAVFLCACATPSQVYWDNKVKEMCEKDGGVTVYETVGLTKEERKLLRIRDMSHATPQDIYYSEFNSKTIESGNPAVYKTTLSIYRNNDKKLLGTEISYGRQGGDIPSGISHQSSYSCDQVSGFNNITDRIFITKGD